MREKLARHAQVLGQYPFLEQPFEEEAEKTAIEDLRAKIGQEKQIQEKYKEDMKRLVAFGS